MTHSFLTIKSSFKQNYSVQDNNERHRLGFANGFAITVSAMQLWYWKNILQLPRTHLVKTILKASLVQIQQVQKTSLQNAHVYSLLFSKTFGVERIINSLN